MKKIIRCVWSEGDDLYRDYHDREWGVPCLDDEKLFEFILLEGAQAGLSWITVLRKRANYRRAFANFDPSRIARFGDKDIARLLKDEGIIRNQAKIRAAVSNARVYLEVKAREKSFARFLWQFVEGKPIQNHWRSMKEVPATSKESDAMSKELKRRGFKFVGSTICYAHMQATGMVNDHVVGCHRYPACAKLARAVNLRARS